MAKDLLIEIGVEELPVSFLSGALAAMPDLAGSLLDEARLSHGAFVPAGTPRRLTLLIEGVQERQDDLALEVHGPPERVALDASGAPTKAAIGFARKQGVDPAALYVVETSKGRYVAVKREEAGRAAAEVLPDVIAELVRRIPFAKSMRWGEGEIAFGRPIHWVCALFGDEVLAAEVAGIAAGRTTRGHRFLAPAPLEVSSPADYFDALEAAHVVVRVEDRRRRMHEALLAAARDLDGELVEDAFLLDECTSLVEEPHVVPGRFDESFLDLPESVIVSVMRDHQRYFAVRARATGVLLPRYLNVVNTATDPKTISIGNDRVLRARLADARFFVDEDRKKQLADRTTALDKVVFQNRLGSLGDKVRRIRRLMRFFFDEGAERQLAERAAVLCKNDLLTQIVGEFPELQGEMGAFYAREQGEDPTVVAAIEEHYLPRGAADGIPSASASAAVALADRADTLVGCFGIGLTPTGSADPFALRRAALGIVRTALGGPFDVSARDLFGEAWDGYPDGLLAPRDEVVGRLDEFVRARLKAHYGAEHATDLVDACLSAWDGGSIRDLDRRIAALAAFRELPEYERLAIAFKRAFNIAKDGPSGDVDPSRLVEDAERVLAERFSALRPEVKKSVDGGAYGEALSTLARELKDPIDRFFDEVLVIHDDEALRHNRLRLLRGISDMLTDIAHFHQLSTR